MIINLYVQQLWWLYLLMLIAIDVFTVWLRIKQDNWTAAEEFFGTLSSLSICATVTFVTYVWVYVLQIKIVIGA